MVRMPDDFSRKLKWESLIKQHTKYEHNPDLKKAAEEWAGQEANSETIFKELAGLHIPLTQIRRAAKELFLNLSEKEHEKIIKEIESDREKHPFYLEPVIKNGVPSSELHMMSSGACNYIAKITAEISGSYLFTDIPPKWREIEIDREQCRRYRKQT